MSAPLTLTEYEIQRLTGLRQPAAQERYLREVLHIPARRNRANQVIVLRKDVEGREAPARRREPRLDWLRGAG